MSWQGENFGFALKALASAISPDRPALLHGERVVTWGEFDALTDRVAAGLAARGLRPGDVMVAISFAPYSEETLALADEAQRRGLPVIALTDTLSSPLARKATAVLTVQEVDFGAFRSLSATLALALSLAVAVGKARGA